MKEGMSTDDFDLVSDTESIEENDSTGRPPPPSVTYNTDMEPKRKPWVKDIRNEGNKTIFGKSGIQIRGLSLPKKNCGSLKKKNSFVRQNSDDSDVTSDELRNKKRSKNDEKENRNSSSASTENDSVCYNKAKKKHKPTKKKNSPPAKKIPESSSETEITDDEDELLVHKQKKNSRKAHEEAPTINLNLPEKQTQHGKENFGKRKRQLSGPYESGSKPSTTKKLKFVIEESTEDSSDNRMLSLKNSKLKHSLNTNGRGFKKNVIEEESSSTESEDIKMNITDKLKKNNSLVVPELSLRFSSDEETECEQNTSLNVKPIKLKNDEDEDPRSGLPLLVRPRARHNSSNSDSSVRSTVSNASTVMYQHSDSVVAKNKNQIQNSQCLSDVEENNSGSDSDVPLGEIMKKRNSPLDKRKPNNAQETTSADTKIMEKEQAMSSIDSESELLFPQNEPETIKNIKEEENSASYTKEEDCIFIVDSDDDLYSSMSQQNQTIDYNDLPAENEEDQLARFFLGDDETNGEDVEMDFKPKSLDWLTNSTQKYDTEEGIIANKYDLQTQVSSVIKSERTDDYYDADTQIIVCDDFDDSDGDLYFAETQFPNDSGYGAVKSKDTSFSDSQNLYNAETQDFKSDKSFNLDQSDDEQFYNEPTQIDRDIKKKRRETNEYDLATQIENKTDKSSKLKKEKIFSDLYEAPTQVDGANKRSLTKRSSDEGMCTVEHTKVETVKITKQFSSTEEAEKYLKKVKSTPDKKLMDEDATQEYEWDKEQSVTPKKTTIYSQNTVDIDKGDENMDVYDIMTQINSDKKAVKSATKNKKKAVEVIEIEDDEDDQDLYNAATQLEFTRGNNVRKPFKSTDDKSFTRDINQLSTNLKVVVPKEVFDAMTQMEYKPKVKDDMSNFYSANTQAPSHSQEKNDDNYFAETQMVSDHQEMDDSDEDLFNAATQVDLDLKQSTDRKGDYSAQTQVESREEISSDDCFDMMTQVERQPKHSQKVEDRNFFAAMTQVENLCNDNEENEDIYNAQTQVENDRELTFSDDNHTTVRENQETNESDQSVEYICMLEDEEEEEQPSPEISDSDYVIMLDDSPTEEEIPGQSGPSGIFKDKTPKKDKTYEKHTLLKKVSSDEKKAKFTSPQKQKTRKEIRESFKFEKESFYSKQPKTKVDSKNVDVSDVGMVDEEQWLSAKQRKAKNNERTTKRQTSKVVSKTSDTNLAIEDKIQKAKSLMAERKKQIAAQPRPVKRKRSSAEMAADISDVRLPDQKEIMAKGLPLLEFPQDKISNSQSDKEDHVKETGEPHPKLSKKDEENTTEKSSGSQKSSCKDRSDDKHRREHKKSESSSKHRNDKKSDRSSHRSRHEDKSSDRNKHHKLESKHKEKSDHERKDKHKHSNKSDRRDKEDRDKNSKHKDENRSKDKGRSSHDKKVRSNSDKKKTEKSHENKDVKRDNDEKKYKKDQSKESSEKKGEKLKDKHRKEKSSSSNKSSSSSSGKKDGESSKKSDGINSEKDERKIEDKEKSKRDSTSTNNTKTTSEKSNEIQSKSNQTLDSLMSKGVMSLIGMSGNFTSQMKQNLAKSSQRDSSDVNKIDTHEDSNDVEIKESTTESRPVISMYRERTEESQQPTEQTVTKQSIEKRGSNSEKQPKPILMMSGVIKKGLNVTFRLPTYSQSAENKRLQNLEKPFPKEKWSKNCFPGGKLPQLPYQENVPVFQQPNVPTSMQPNEARSILTQNQSLNTNQGLQGQGGALPRPPPRPGGQPSNVMDKQVQPRPLPMCRPGGSPSSDINILDINYFFVKILKWNGSWFNEYEKNQMTPPAIEEAHPVKHLLESYNSYEDYFNILFPHLMLETWETCVKSWQDNKGRDSVDVVFTRVEKPNDKLFLYTFTAVVPKHFNNLLNENDLVIINTWGVHASKKSGKQSPQYYPQLGFIERIRYHRYKESVEKTLKVFPLLGKDRVSSSDLIGLEISVKARVRQFKLLQDKTSNIKVVCSLVSTVRHYYALSHLYRTSISENILKPGAIRVFHNHPTIKEDDMADLEEYNPSQKKAICVAARLALEPVENNRIYLIQGPPGTGKSHTIIGVIKKIFKKSNRQCRICLCAPSNAAVDELVKRLIKERRKMEEQSKHSGFHLIRIGKSTENVSSDVHKYAFFEVAKSNQAEELKKKRKQRVSSSILQEIDRLNERIAATEQELTEKTVRMHKFEAGKINSELAKLRKKKIDMEEEIKAQYKNVRLTREEEEEIKKNVLLKSHIICGTLNSFGNGYYMNYLAPYVAQKRRSRFHCVIMDEASQATELDTLVPVQYGTTKLIMVGDPEQLPPTVLSQQSSNKSYGQSLFERFYNHFRYSDVNPVTLLDTQYRMHPDIVHFPSKYVYGGRLKTDPSVEERCTQFDLKPYILFDLQEGQELTTQPGARLHIINSAEAEFTIELCEFLTKRTKVQEQDIGIISPYQQQKRIIRDGLASRNIHNIEVNTVDSFQGQEKEVIVLTCTRAKSTSGGIGFLANRKRMNVALTRGKSALYVVGDLTSLKKGDEAWRSLIEDGEMRHVIRKVNTGERFDMVFNTCLSMNRRLGRVFIT